MASGKRVTKAAGELIIAKKLVPRAREMSIGNVARGPKLSENQLTDFLLEIRDSYFARLNVIDQNLARMRIRTYQILTAEIAGFLAFIKLFSSINSTTFTPTPFLNLSAYHAILWVVVSAVFIGFFFSLALICKIELPRKWHDPTVHFDAKLAINNPISVSKLRKYYLVSLENDVKSDENFMKDHLNKTYGHLIYLVAVQITFIGAIGTYALLYLRVTRF